MTPISPRTPLLHFALFALFVLAVSLAGCSERRSLLLPNQNPEVTLERPSFVGDGDSRSMVVKWRGHDPDGKIDHYVFAVNPRSVDLVDQAWTRTEAITTTVAIQRSTPLGRVSGTSLLAGQAPSIFAVRAVDAAGAMSPPATFATFGANIAPTVQITSPEPSLVFTAIVPPDFTVRWQGADVDGQITQYKYRLFPNQNPDFPEIPDFAFWATGNPEAVREFYAPDFAGWETVSASTQSVRIENLDENQLYLFVVVAIDDAGGYTAPFSGATNMLRVAVSSYVGLPQFCVSSSFFNHCAVTGGDLELTYELPAQSPFTVSWFAYPAFGSEINGYRWVLDPIDPTDERPRSHPSNDVNHWTPWNVATTSATLGPFKSKDLSIEHVLYVQARDDLDRISTLRLRFTLIPAAHAREVLVVDDTRLFPDQFAFGGVLQPPRGPWPTAAELDTFLYARGGNPYRGYPEGTLSPRGLLDGFDFDTLGTRGIPNGVVPLSLLSQYRHVVWIVDDVSATYTGSPIDILQPITSLRLMSNPGQASTLASYVAQGGKLWLLGGGAAYATLASWQRRNTPPDEFTNSDGELVAGRFMYDFSHWRSGIKLGLSTVPLSLNHSSVVQDPTAAPGRGWAGQPNYEKLLVSAPSLQLRTPATDPPPPLRLVNSFTYPGYFAAERLFQPNVIVEDVDPRPNRERLESTLDSLYVLPGTVPSPTMTYYHGLENGSVVFSGFPVWQFQRSQAAALVDFVFQDIWGLPKQSAVIAANGSSSRPSKTSTLHPKAVPGRR